MEARSCCEEYASSYKFNACQHLGDYVDMRFSSCHRLDFFQSEPKTKKKKFAMHILGIRIHEFLHVFTYMYIK